MPGSSLGRLPSGGLLAALGVLVLTAAGAHGQTGAAGNVGYVDSALPVTQFRLRYDAAFDDNRLYRAEFFYPKPGAFRTAPPPLNDPHAPGGADLVQSVDYQDVSAYVELA